LPPSGSGSTLAGMKLVAPVKLLPSPEQAVALLGTLARCNEACDWLAEAGLAAGKTRQYDLHRLAYAELRSRFGLTAQAAVRCIAKVADAFKVNREVAPRFRRDAAQPYDDRIVRFAADDTANLWTIAGRLRIRFVTGEKQRALLAHRKGETDLALIRGRWFLICTCDIPAPECYDPEDWLGVDLGIRNLAADSDGEAFSGAEVQLARRVFAHRRRNLQRKGTKAARRKLRGIKGKQARFQADTNHRVSKAIAAKAERSRRGIALEDLRGIRGRVKARRRQRAMMANWAFRQLATFVVYKAALAGVPVVLVDPTNTSRECPACGHVEKANRRDRDTFRCRSCDFAGEADAIAAVNIRSRARAARRPADVDEGRVAQAA
jgi:putative transposase